jgi:hypothetical protein
MGLFRTITSPFFLSFSPSALDSASEESSAPNHRNGKKEKKRNFASNTGTNWKKYFCRHEQVTQYAQTTTGFQTEKFNRQV